MLRPSILLYLRASMFSVLHRPVLLYLPLSFVRCGALLVAKFCIAVSSIAILATNFMCCCFQYCYFLQYLFCNVDVFSRLHQYHVIQKLYYRPMICEKFINSFKTRPCKICLLPGGTGSALYINPIVYNPLKRFGSNF